MATKVSSAKMGRIKRLKGYWPLGLMMLVGLVALTLFLITSFEIITPAPAQPVTTPVSDQSVFSPVQPVPQAVVEALTMLDVQKILLRTGIRPEGEYPPSVDVLLADPVYFAVTGRNLPETVQQEPALLFYVIEDSHENLPIDPAMPLLKVDGTQVGEPVEIIVLADSYHHRTSIVRYAAADAQGLPVITNNTDLLELVFTSPDGEEASYSVLSWKLPLQYTDNFSSRQVALGISTQSGEVLTENFPAQEESQNVPVRTGQVVVSGANPTPSGGIHLLSWAAILAIMAGMLTVLSPCLIQLVVYYAATLAAVSTEGGNAGTLDSVAARKHIIQTGLFFTLGFTLVYTAGGAAAGYIGQSLDKLGLLNTWMRPISVVAGVVIIIMAVRVAWTTRAPLICRLPMAPLFGNTQRTGVLASALMGISFAGGCLACFSATVLPALLLYAGSTGSVIYGALLLLIFSLGVSLPCLAIAFGVSTIQPLMVRLQNSGRFLGLASALVMAGFGVIMITDQFHLVSGFVYQMMGLS